LIIKISCDNDSYTNQVGTRSYNYAICTHVLGSIDQQPAPACHGGKNKKFSAHIKQITFYHLHYMPHIHPLSGKIL